MTTPKSPEDVMKELFYGDTEQCVEANLHQLKMGYINETTAREQILAHIKTKLEGSLRSSMASLLCYMAERMPNLDEPKGMLAKVAPNNHQQIIGYNAALDDCRTLLIEEARKISNK